MLLAACTFSGLQAKVTKPASQANAPQTDREFWCATLYKIAAPVLREMSQGTLKREMQLELSPTWDGRDSCVSYMEAFGRTMAGVAPWLTLPNDDTKEGAMRKELRGWALKAYANAVDPESPDYLLWRREGQPMVDAAYIAESFLRAYDRLWMPLDSLTKARYIEEFQQLRRIDPPYNNWLLFSAEIECFLKKAGAQYDQYRINSALRKIEEWYQGDGWYSDGSHFNFDYYGSNVIHPMYLECLDVLTDNGRNWARVCTSSEQYEAVWKRTQRFSVILERFISPEGSYPAFGRSITYRMAAFQPIALLAWKKRLPAELHEGQVRAALTAVMKRMFTGDQNFNAKGYLTLGFNGSQPDISDYYTNNGSLYMTTLAFLPLGLPADDTFWTSPAEDWTQKKAWSGEEFPRDQAWE